MIIFDCHNKWCIVIDVITHLKKISSRNTIETRQKVILQQQQQQNKHKVQMYKTIQNNNLYIYGVTRVI